MQSTPKSTSITRLSSKGQVVIPEEIRKRLRLKVGMQFAVIGEDDVVVLKAIEEPSMRDFDRLIKTARQQAKQSGMKQSDIAKAIQRVRDRQA